MQKVKISLEMPGSEQKGRLFVLPLNQNMQEDRSEFLKVKNILVITNIKGDFTSLRHLLIRNNVISKYLDWVFDENHLVIISDGISCDTLAPEYLWFVYSLQQKAQRKGGGVHFILGNQEILNLQGSWRYEHPNYAVVRPESKYAVTALYYGNNEIWNWMSSRNIIEKMGSFLLVPCGISPAVNKLRTSVSKINRFARRHYLDARLPKFIRSNAELLLNSKHSPLSYTGYFDGTATDKQLIETLQIFGVKQIITAYDGAAPGIYCNGKVINVMTKSGSEGPSGLLIRKGRFYLIDHLGSRVKVEV